MTVTPGLWVKVPRVPVPSLMYTDPFVRAFIVLCTTVVAFVPEKSTDPVVPLTAFMVPLLL